jgi:NADPH-ferrihemoprotein reductase
MHLEGLSSRPYNAYNPYIAPIVESRDLFKVEDRNCLHMEIDISGSYLKYETGDHIAIWPTNSGKGVDRFLCVTGLLRKRDAVINISALDSESKVPFTTPTPTTYDTAVRYYMDIQAPVSPSVHRNTGCICNRRKKQDGDGKARQRQELFPQPD